MKRILFLLVLFSAFCAALPLCAQEAPEPDYAAMDRQMKQFAELEIHDVEELERISSDLIKILMSMDKKKHTRWYLQNVIQGVNEISKTMEHEALLIKIGLDYVKGSEKSLFYRNILENRLEQNSREIRTSLELLMSRDYLITDDAALDLIAQAEEVARSNLESRKRYARTLQGVDRDEGRQSAPPE